MFISPPLIQADKIADRFQPIEIVAVINDTPITVAERSKARIVFAYSNDGAVVSNSTRSMDMCVLYVGSGLATG
jgi:hypothetical protein